MLVLRGTVQVFVCPEWFEAPSNLLHEPFPKAGVEEIIAHLVEFDIYTEPQRSMELTLDPDFTVESRSAHLVHVADLQGPFLLNVAFQFASCLGIKKAPQIAVRCADDVVLQRLSLDCAVVDPTLRESVRQRMMSIHTRFMPPPTLDQWKQAFGPWWCPNDLGSFANGAAAPLVLCKGDAIAFNYTLTPHLPLETSVYLVLHGTLDNYDSELGAAYIWPSPGVALFACVSARTVVASPHLICWKISRGLLGAAALRNTPCRARAAHPHSCKPFRGDLRQATALSGKRHRGIGFPIVIGAVHPFLSMQRAPHWAFGCSAADAG